MELNNPVSPVQNTPTTTPPPELNVMPKSKTMWLIVGLVVIILLIAGIYLYQSRQQKVSQPLKTTPPATTVDNLESDLNSINVGDVDSEFTSVDQDLQGL